MKESDLRIPEDNAPRTMKSDGFHDSSIWDRPARPRLAVFGGSFRVSRERENDFAPALVVRSERR
jgi:hypothetical protein